MIGGCVGHSMSIPVSGPMIGGCVDHSMTSPLKTSKAEPCKGQMTVFPMTSAPVLRGVPMCGQLFWTTKILPPSVFPTRQSTPVISTALSCLGAKSPALIPVFDQTREGKIVAVEYLAAVLLGGGVRRLAANSAATAPRLQIAPAPTAALAPEARPPSPSAATPPRSEGSARGDSGDGRTKL